MTLVRWRNMKRRASLQANPVKTAEWRRRTARRLPAFSARRKSEQAERAKVRRIVLERDRGCQAVRRLIDAGWGPVRCGYYPPDRPWLEVHELVSRGRNSKGYLDPTNCVSLCPAHHDWVTAHPADAEQVGLYRRTGST